MIRRLGRWPKLDFEAHAGRFHPILSSPRARVIAFGVAGVALSACLAMAGERTITAAPADTIFSAITVADGERSSVEATRGSDGTMKVTVRGAFFDGRRLVKAILGLAVASAKDARNSASNVDLDIKVTALGGFNGEELHDVELNLSEQGGKIGNFALTAKLGIDARLVADLRSYHDRRPAIYLEASDAGAFFRFIDLYPRMATGQMSLVLDMPPDDASREGFLIVRDFVVHREHIAEPSIAPLQPNPIPDLQNGVGFSRLLVEFSLSGRTLAISQGIASGPFVNATLKGRIDFAGNDVKARGIVLPGSGRRDQGVLLPPFDGVNPALGFAYDVIGPLHAPIVRTRPTSAIPPSLLHRLFEFPAVRE